MHARCLTLLAALLCPAASDGGKKGPPAAGKPLAVFGGALDAVAGAAGQ